MMIAEAFETWGAERSLSVRSGFALRRRGTTRRTIVRTAQRLLRERSQDGVSMDAVAEAAGVTRRTIYNHFADRAQLLAAAREAEIAALSGAGCLAPRDDLPAEEALVAFARDAAELLGSARLIDVLRSIAKDGAQQRWLADAYVRNVRAPLLQSLEAYLCRLGHARLGIGDAGIEAQQLVGLIEAAVLLPPLLHLDSGTVDHDAVARRTVGLFVAAADARRAALPAGTMTTARGGWAA